MSQSTIKVWQYVPKYYQSLAIQATAAFKCNINNNMPIKLYDLKTCQLNQINREKQGYNIIVHAYCNLIRINQRRVVFPTAYLYMEIQYQISSPNPQALNFKSHIKWLHCYYSCCFNITIVQPHTFPDRDDLLTHDFEIV